MFSHCIKELFWSCDKMNNTSNGSFNVRSFLETSHLFSHDWEITIWCPQKSGYWPRHSNVWIVIHLLHCFCKWKIPFDSNVQHVSAISLLAISMDNVRVKGSNEGQKPEEIPRTGRSSVAHNASSLCPQTGTINTNAEEVNAYIRQVKEQAHHHKILDCDGNTVSQKLCRAQFSKWNRIVHLLGIPSPYKIADDA